MINSEVIYKCTLTNLPFPEVVKCLAEIGIERYYTDLYRMEKIFYSQDGETYIERMPIDNMPKIAESFSEADLKNTIHAAQNREINYDTFIKKIANAGIASYMVYIAGKQVMYAGRKGEFYVEKF